MKITDTIGLVLKRKGQARILSIAPGQSVFEAIQLLAKYDIGALLVICERQAGRHLLRARLRPQGRYQRPPLPRHPGRRDHDQHRHLRYHAPHRRRMHDHDDPWPLPPSSRPRRATQSWDWSPSATSSSGSSPARRKPFRSCRATSPAPIPRRFLFPKFTSGMRAPARRRGINSVCQPGQRDCFVPADQAGKFQHTAPEYRETRPRSGKIAFEPWIWVLIPPRPIHSSGSTVLVASSGAIRGGFFLIKRPLASSLRDRATVKPL